MRAAGRSQGRSMGATFIHRAEIAAKCASLGRSAIRDAPFGGLGPLCRKAKVSKRRSGRCGC